MLIAVTLLSMPVFAGSTKPLPWALNPSRNMAVKAAGLPSEIRDEDRLWATPLGSHQYTLPVVMDGRIFTGANDMELEGRFKGNRGGLVVCLSEKTGEIIWQFPMPKIDLPGHHFNRFKCGICSSPVVEGDRLYLVGSRGEIVCMDVDGQADGNDGPFTDELGYLAEVLVGEKRLLPEDGDIVWRYDLISELNIYPHDVAGSVLLLDGDLIYACSGHGVLGDHISVANQKAPSLIVFNKKTGKLVARDDERIGERMLHGSWSSPAMAVVGGRKLVYYGGGDGLLYAFDVTDLKADSEKVQTLEKVWARDCNLPEYRMRDGKKIPYATWRNEQAFGPSEIIATPVIHNGRIYVASGQSPYHGPGKGVLMCMDAATGEIVWQSTLVDRTTSTVAISGGLLYIADYTGGFHCFDADSGERLWFYEMKAGTWISSPLVADGKVYISDERKWFYVFEDGREMKLLSSQHLNSMPMTPVVANGVFYLATQKELIALRTKGGEK